MYFVFFFHVNIDITKLTVNKYHSNHIWRNGMAHLYQFYFTGVAAAVILSASVTHPPPIDA